MAFQLNTSISDHKNLISLLETFLGANGWTVVDSGSSSEQYLYVSRSNAGETFYYEIESTSTDDIRIRATTSSQTYPSAEADPSDYVYLNLINSTILKSWFFTGDTYCHIVVEVASGYFQQAGFGRLTPAFSFSSSDLTGSFCYGNNGTTWSSLTTSDSTLMSRLSLGDYSRNTIRQKATSGNLWSQAYCLNESSTSYLSYYIERYYNSTGDRPIFPINVSVVNLPDTPTLIDTYIIGSIPGMRMFNSLNLVNASELTIGSDVWVKFPISYSNYSVGTYSFNIGFACLK